LSQVIEELLESITRYAARTPNRTFILYPAAILGLRLIERGGLSWFWSPLLVWGYLQYRLCGRYRMRLGRGGPGLQSEPEELVTSGPYSVVRNPMYLGHIIFLTGLALFTRRRLAAILAVGVALWFDRRVRDDEDRLEALFGDSYREYRARVRRWIPLPGDMG